MRVSPVGRALVILARGSYLVLAIVIIFALSYLLGHSMLGELKGNDSPLHVAYALWWGEYFPSLPHWYPLQGGGVSILHGYPILAHLVVVILSRLSGVSILQAFRLVGFLGFPLTALGIYFFCWNAFRKQTIGLLAAIFYLLAPVSWTWMYNWGFFAQQVGLVFLPPALIAFDRALKCQLDKRRAGQGRLWFVALTALVVLGSLTHLLIGSAAAAGLVLYTAFLALSSPRAGRTSIVRAGFKILSRLGLLVVLLTALYVVPFFSYNRIANREGLNDPVPHQLHRLPILEFFGLRPTDSREILTRMQFPLVVTAFALTGTILASLLAPKGEESSEKTKAWALVNIAGTVYVLTPALVAMVLRISPLLSMFVSFRSLLLLVMVLMPAISAYGVWSLARLLLLPIQLIAKDRPPQTGGKRSAKPLVQALTAMAALAIASGGISTIGSYSSKSDSHLPYGPYPDGIDLNDLWAKGPKPQAYSMQQQLALENWPAFSLGDEDTSIARSRQLASLLPEERPLRIDISPWLGRLAMDLAHYADVSQINTYTYTLSLLHAMWGDQQNVFFSRDEGVTERGNPRTLNGLAQWFGTEFVFLNPYQDPVETYEQAGWERLYRETDSQVWQHPDRSDYLFLDAIADPIESYRAQGWQLVGSVTPIELWRYPDAPGMATATTRPAVLVIGKPKADAYMTVFRLANNGLLPYQEALLVEGQSRIDSYSAEDLRPFDAVLLYGYDYKNSEKAWEIVAAYVAEGGSLFVDTGWEFWVPEWEFAQAPAVLPVERLTWTNYGATDDYAIGSPEIAGEVDLDSFKPLVWEGVAWTLSGAEASDLRDWGQAVLNAAGRPLIVAGQYGKGRVVWSGMNLIGHIRYGETSEAEIALLRNLLRWLTTGGELPVLALPSIERDNPDQVKMTFGTEPGDITWLYWREAYHPNWHAYLADGREVPIFRGGPGFMLMPVETGSEQASISLNWEPSVAERAAMIPTVAGFVLLSALLIDGLVLGGNGFTWLKLLLSMRTPRPFLGEGSNLEWAERKRAEIEVGLAASPTRKLSPGEALPWMRRETSEANQGALLPIDQVEMDEALPQEEELLRAWLEAGHEHNAWVGRMLERKRAKKEGSS